MVHLVSDLCKLFRLTSNVLYYLMVQHGVKHPLLVAVVDSGRSASMAWFEAMSHTCSVTGGASKTPSSKLDKSSPCTGS